MTAVPPARPVAVVQESSTSGEVDGPELQGALRPELVSTTVIGRYLGWLGKRRGISFDSYADLHRWSVTDLEGFWSSIRDFFDVREHTPAERALGRREMPGAEWFPGATLNYVEHALRRAADAPDDMAVIAHSQTRDEVRLSWRELREQVSRARAGLARLGVGPGDRVVAYLPNIPESVVAFLATASLGAVWASCAPVRIQELQARRAVTRSTSAFRGGAVGRHACLLEEISPEPKGLCTGRSRAPHGCCHRWARDRDCTPWGERLSRGLTREASNRTARS